MSKQWPANKKTIDIESATQPIIECIQDFYHIEEKEIKKSVRYKGYLRPKNMAHVVPEDPNRDLNNEGLAYHKERGRTPLEILITLAFQLGMEQGRRWLLEEEKLTRSILDITRYNKTPEIKNAVQEKKR